MNEEQNIIATVIEETKNEEDTVVTNEMTGESDELNESLDDDYGYIETTDEEFDEDDGEETYYDMESLDTVDEERIKRNSEITKKVKQAYPNLDIHVIDVVGEDYFLRPISFPEVFDIYSNIYERDELTGQPIINEEKYEQEIISRAVLHPEKILTELDSNPDKYPGNIRQTLADAINLISGNYMLFPYSYEEIMGPSEKPGVSNYDLETEMLLERDEEMERPTKQQLKEWHDKYGKSMAILRFQYGKCYYVFRGYNYKESKALMEECGLNEKTITESLALKEVQEYLVDKFLLFPDPKKRKVTSLYGAPGYLITSVGEGIYQLSGGVGALDTLRIVEA